ncbi:MAG: hypothetical protein ACTS3F_10770 [Phycisphaerales bacterium]
MATRRDRGTGGLFRKTDTGPWWAQWSEIDAGRRKVRRRSTGTRSKAEAGRILAAWVERENQRRAGLIDRRAETIAEHAGKPIETHLTDWLGTLANRTAKHRTMTDKRVRRMLTDCGIRTLSDLDPVKIERWMIDRQTAGDAAKTINAHLQALKQLCRWCVSARRLATNPLEGVRPLQSTDPTFERRAFNADELATLDRVTENAPAWRTLSGWDRSILIPGRCGHRVPGE